MRREVILGLVVAVAIVVALTYSSMQLRQHTCRVCTTYNGQTNCATASGATKEEAMRTATTTACAPISNGMTQTIQCGNTAPISVEWRP
jgi:cytochrome c oxidase assembly protein Cox11